MSISLFKLAAAVAVSFVFFVTVSTLHSMFGVSFMDQKKPAEKRKILAELVSAPPEKKKPEQVHVRRVQSAAHTEQAGAAGQMAVKFAPDLTVDAGDQTGAVALQSQDLQAEIFNEGETDEPATATYNPPVPYPDRARELGIEGTLVVTFVIDHKGNVTSLDIVKSPHPSFSAEARKVIPTWKFKPAKNKGVPVNQRAKKEIEFQLE